MTRSSPTAIGRSGKDPRPMGHPYRHRSRTIAAPTAALRPTPWITVAEPAEFSAKRALSRAVDRRLTRDEAQSTCTGSHRLAAATISRHVCYWPSDVLPYAYEHRELARDFSVAKCNFLNTAFPRKSTVKSGDTQDPGRETDSLRARSLPSIEIRPRRQPDFRCVIDLNRDEKRNSTAAIRSSTRTALAPKNPTARARETTTQHQAHVAVQHPSRLQTKSRPRSRPTSGDPPSSNPPRRADPLALPAPIFRPPRIGCEPYRAPAPNLLLQKLLPYTIVRNARCNEEVNSLPWRMATGNGTVVLGRLRPECSLNEILDRPVSP